MKVNELMIGDWVESGGICYRVDGIYSIDIISADDGISHYNILSSSIRPIPLTESILVKNGFEKYKASKYFHEYTLNDKNYSCFEICWSSVNGFNYNGDFMLHYVHQLQHLLRLAGVEKDIEL